MTLRQRPTEVLDPWGLVLLAGDPHADTTLARMAAGLLLRSGAVRGDTIEDVIAACLALMAYPSNATAYARRSATVR